MLARRNACTSKIHCRHPSRRAFGELVDNKRLLYRKRHLTVVHRRNLLVDGNPYIVHKRRILHFLKGRNTATQLTRNNYTIVIIAYDRIGILRFRIQQQYPIIQIVRFRSTVTRIPSPYHHIRLIGLWVFILKNVLHILVTVNPVYRSPAQIGRQRNRKIIGRPIESSGVPIVRSHRTISITVAERHTRHLKRHHKTINIFRTVIIIHRTLLHRDFRHVPT